MCMPIPIIVLTPLPRSTGVVRRGSARISGGGRGAAGSPLRRNWAARLHGRRGGLAWNRAWAHTGYDGHLRCTSGLGLFNVVEALSAMVAFHGR